MFGCIGECCLSSDFNNQILKWFLNFWEGAIEPYKNDRNLGHSLQTNAREEFET